MRPQLHKGVRRAGTVVVASLALPLAALLVACEPVTPTCDGRPATIQGTAGDDVITGTEGPDVIVGLSGRDTISGLGGNDAICAGLGLDHVDGGEGADSIDGTRDTDILDGGPGEDTLTYASHPFGVQVYLDRDEGGDLDVVRGFETVVGSRFDDWLIGDELDNRLVGGAGTDTLTGQAGNDQLVDGGSSNPDERNNFFGGPGNDLFYGGRSYDVVSYRSSGAGSVWVNLANGLAFGEGDDLMSGIDHLIGSPGNDTLQGSAAGETIVGDRGDDWIRGAGGDDHLWGGEGRDTASWYGLPTGMTADLTQGVAYATDGNDDLHEIEDLGGGDGNDTLVGDAGPNIIDGSNGTDFCTGNGGLDTLFRCP